MQKKTIVASKWQRRYTATVGRSLIVSDLEIAIAASPACLIAFLFCLFVCLPGKFCLSVCELFFHKYIASQVPQLTPRRVGGGVVGKPD